jgi:hypothetical protein
MSEPDDRNQDLARVAEIIKQLDALGGELAEIAARRNRVRDNLTGRFVRVGYEHIVTGAGSLRRAQIVKRESAE